MPNTAKIKETAEFLLAAEANRTEQDPLSAERWPELDLETAFEVQDEILAQKLAQGEQLTGVKMGLTSKAKQQTMNVDVPAMGWITSGMEFPLNSAVPTERLIHPRVEPEIFFRLGQDIKGPNVTIADVIPAIAEVYAGVDVIDSRYKAFKFTLPDVVADNSSGAAYVIGPISKPLSEVDLELEAVLVEVDGQVVDSATGAAILGHPLAAVAAGANMMHARGLHLKAGWLVLAGAMTDAIPVTAGKSISFHFSTLGSIHLPEAK